MKKILYGILIVILFNACKKDALVTNGTIYDKSLSVIRASIQGRWQLHYMNGGYSGSDRQDFNNSFVTFNDDHIVWTVNDSIRVNSSINWIYGDDILSGKSYIMQPPEWLVYGIYNDTLILFDNFTDAYTYHLTRK